jgi:class 3 adenylate cyclase
MPHEDTSQHLTVMFCDLVGSTDLSGRLDPEDLREVVRAYQHASETIITRYSGYIAQYQGDGLLVYFCYLQSYGDEAQRTVHTALGIIAMLDDLNTRLEQTHGVHIAVRTPTTVQSRLEAAGTTELSTLVGRDTAIGRTGMALR